MKSSSIFIGIIGAIGAYLVYKYYYLPKTQTTNTSSANAIVQSEIKSVQSPSTSSTYSTTLQSGTKTMSQAISSGLISSSKVATLTPSQLKITEVGLGSPIKTAIQKNTVSNALITTAGLTTNTTQGEAYGAKLSNASRLVRVMNTQIPSKPISNHISKSTITSSISHPITTTKSIIEPKQSISTSQVHISSPQTIALNRIQSVMKNRSMMRF